LRNNPSGSHIAYVPARDWLEVVSKSKVFKRSVYIQGQTTSISLEDAFWDALGEIASARNMREYPDGTITCVSAPLQRWPWGMVSKQLVSRTVPADRELAEG
jgi:hypothetical protein